jgi:hypothetical protein
MNLRQISVWAALLLAMTSSTVVAADQTTSTPAPAATATVPASVTSSATIATLSRVNRDDQVICETVEEIGSRLGDRKICLTRGEWRHQSNVRGGMQTTVVGGCANEVSAHSKC